MALKRTSDPVRRWRAATPACSSLFFALALLPVTAVRAEGAPEPKVAIVIAGDPDRTLREAAQRLDVALGERAMREEVELVADPGLRVVLVGGGTATDGFEALRIERRKLGIDEGTDRHALLQLAGPTGVDLFLVVRRRAGAAEVEAFDAHAGAFYEGRLALTSIDGEALRSFVQKRSRATARRMMTTAGAATEVAGNAKPEPATTGGRVESTATTDASIGAASAASQTSTRAAATASTGGSPTTPSALPRGTPPSDKGAATNATGAPGEAPVVVFFKRNWPYFLAGALLAGVGAVLIVSSVQSNNPAPPMLVFRPGGSP